MSHEELARQDVAVMNLACSYGLDGSENIDLEACLRQLDAWASEIAGLLESRRSIYQSYHARTGHSFNRWRCACIVSYLQNAAGVQYTAELKNHSPGGYDDTSFYRNSKDAFISGILADGNRATCASMPVVFVALGRRLGFPVGLVMTRNHLFARWDDGTERFNIECTDQYAEFKPDEFYRSFPERLNEGEEERMGYLISLTPARQLAGFLHLRGLCLRENGRYEEAREAFLASIKTNPQYFAAPAQNVFIHMIERDIAMRNTAREAALRVER